MAETTGLWSSPHNPTSEQLQSLKQIYSKVEFLKDTHPELFAKICDSPSDGIELGVLAQDLLKETAGKVLIQPAGSPAFQFALGGEVEARRQLGMPCPTVIYAHSKRVNVDEVQEDGSIKKTSIFKHEGWIKM